MTNRGFEHYDLGRPALSVTDGFDRLKRLEIDFSKISQISNESDTRFHFIDRLLTECLGWDRSTISTERFEDGSRTDYELGVPRKIIWEAKRHETSFNFPPKRFSNNIVKLRSVAATDAYLSECISQVTRYCQERGTEVGVVNNGWQLLAFIAVRTDGVKPLDGNAFVVYDQSDLISRFPKLWELLSPDGVAERRIHRFLTGAHNASAPSKISSGIPRYPREQLQSALQIDVQRLTEFFYDYLAGENSDVERFFSYCYVRNNEISKFSTISKELITQKYQRLNSQKEIRPILSELTRTSFGKLVDNVKLDQIMRNPIIIIGEVGVGKTTFLKHLIHAERKNPESSIISINIDLASSGAISQSVSSYVHRAISDQLRLSHKIDIKSETMIRSIYAEEIAEFAEGIYSFLRSKEPRVFDEKLVDSLYNLSKNEGLHVLRALKYLIEVEKRNIVLILDNADQRATDIQKEALAIASETTRSSSVVAFVTLRPETYSKLFSGIRTTSFSQQVFVISPPRIDEVVKRRLRVARQLATGELSSDEIAGVSLDVNAFARVAQALESTISYSNGDLASCLVNFSNGDVNVALRIARELLYSPHLNHARIAKGARHYSIPSIQTHRSLIARRWWDFDEKNSIVVNLFGVVSISQRHHFIGPIILCYLRDEAGVKNSDGFVSRSTVSVELQRSGFTPVATEQALLRLALGGLVECLTGDVIHEGPETGDQWRITARGIYYLRYLIRSPIYIASMSIDTPIFIEAVRASVMTLLSSKSFVDLVAAGVAFREYLSLVWDSEKIDLEYFNWAKIAKSTENDFVAASFNGRAF